MLIEINNPARLSGLKQALYVLHSLHDGRSVDQIVEKLDDDTQLFEIWTNFLTETHCIKRTNSGGYYLTEKGRDWLAIEEKVQ